MSAVTEFLPPLSIPPHERRSKVKPRSAPLHHVLFQVIPSAVEKYSSYCHAYTGHVYCNIYNNK